MTTEIWEHQVLDIPATATEAQSAIAGAGADGWELVAVVPQPANAERLTAFMKRRPLQADASDRGAAASPAAEPVERVDIEPSFNIILTGIRADPASVVIAVARICPSLHLKDAKRLIGASSGILATVPSLEEAEEVAARLLEVGAVVEVVAN